MARIKKELTELIGGTPLLELSRLSRKHDAKAQVVAKLEYFNPGGSVKDRIALAMIEDAETKGILKLLSFAHLKFVRKHKSCV